MYRKRLLNGSCQYLVAELCPGVEQDLLATYPVIDICEIHQYSNTNCLVF